MPKDSYNIMDLRGGFLTVEGEDTGVFPKLWLSKLSKLAKQLATDQNFGGSRTQTLGL